MEIYHLILHQRCMRRMNLAVIVTKHAAFQDIASASKKENSAKRIVAIKIAKTKQEMRILFKKLEKKSNPKTHMLLKRRTLLELTRLEKSKDLLLLVIANIIIVAKVTVLVRKMGSNVLPTAHAKKGNVKISFLMLNVHHLRKTKLARLKKIKVRIILKRIQIFDNKRSRGSYTKSLFILYEHFLLL